MTIVVVFSDGVLKYNLPVVQHRKKRLIKSKRVQLELKLMKYELERMTAGHSEELKLINFESQSEQSKLMKLRTRKNDSWTEGQSDQ